MKEVPSTLKTYGFNCVSLYGAVVYVDGAVLYVNGVQGVSFL